MLIVEREVGDVVVLEPRGRLAADAREEFYQVMNGVLEKGFRKVLLDLANVTYMDSAAVGVLFGAYTSLRRKEGTLRLANVNERLRKILTLVSLEGMIEMSGSVDEALEAFSRRG